MGHTVKRASIATILDVRKCSYWNSTCDVGQSISNPASSISDLITDYFEGTFWPTKEGGGISWQVPAQRVTSRKGVL